MGLKLAHLILAHANPQQLNRLVKRLQHQNADIYIHLDAKSDMQDFQSIGQSAPNVFFIKDRISVSWGTYSIVRATLSGMQEILNSGTTYSHINLLSGQDYPLKSADDIDAFFKANTGKSFIECPVISKEWLSGYRRLMYYDFGDYDFPGHYWMQAVIKFLNIKKRVPDHLIPMGRSQWFSITPESVDYIIKYLKQHPKVERFFRMSFAADEIIFQTILGNSPLKDTIVADNLRYIDFPENENHPTILTINDAEAMITSGKLYARKVNSKVDSNIMDYLDEVAVNKYESVQDKNKVLAQYLSR